MNPANSKLVGIVKFFICVGAMAAAFYDQTILFYKQTNSSFAFFRPRERNQCYSSDKKASSYKNSVVQSKVKVQKIYPGRVIFEK